VRQAAPKKQQQEQAQPQAAQTTSV